MLVKVFGSAVFGVEATTITVEVNIDKGVGYHLVGLPDNAIKESSYRIAAALKNNGYSLPVKKITINMAPADLRKEGSAYDLTLAIGILAASGQIKADEVDKYLIMGELSLDGSLQPIKGALSIAIKAKEEGFKGFFLPIQNVKEAAIVTGLDVYGVENVLQVIDFFDGKGTIEPTVINTRDEFYKTLDFPEFDFADVKAIMGNSGSALMGIGTAKGEDRAVRAAEIAVSSPLLEASIDGAHGVLLLIQGASDLGLHEIDEAARLVQEAVSPEANIIYGTTIDDTLGDEVRITVIAAGFDGGTPQPRKVERTSYNSAFSTPAAAPAAAAPVAAAASATSGWFSTPAEVSTDTAAVPVAEAADEVAPASESAISSLFSPSTPKPQTEDGTFGDDLDIPDFLK